MHMIYKIYVYITYYTIFPNFVEETNNQPVGAPLQVENYLHVY